MPCDRMWHARPCQSGGGDDLRMLRKAVGRSWPMEWDEVFVHAWGIVVDVQWKHFWSWCTGGHVVMLRNHWCSWTLLCVALGSCCSRLAVKIWGSLIFSSHYPVQDCSVSNFFWICSTQSVLSEICCPRGFALKLCRLPWCQRDHVVSVVRRDRHWLCCSEVIYSQ